MDFYTASDIAKNASDTVVNLLTIIDRIKQPSGIDLAILKGHEEIIKLYVTDDVDESQVAQKMAFLSGYKKMMKENRNCKKVIELAAPSISDNAIPDNVDDDWFSFYFDKVRLVSDESVQAIWGKVLANEINTPGSISRSLIHTLSIMGKVQASNFCNVSRFCMYGYKEDENIYPLIFITKNIEAYSRSRITASILMELDNLGLIQCNFIDEYIFRDKLTLRYGSKMIEVYGDNNNDGKIKAGNVILTDDGKKLFDIVGDEYKRYRIEMLDFAITKFQRRGCKVVLNGKEVT